MSVSNNYFQSLIGLAFEFFALTNRGDHLKQRFFCGCKFGAFINYDVKYLSNPARSFDLWPLFLFVDAFWYTLPWFRKQFPLKINNSPVFWDFFPPIIGPNWISQLPFSFENSLSANSQTSLTVDTCWQSTQNPSPIQGFMQSLSFCPHPVYQIPTYFHLKAPVHRAYSVQPYSHF